MNREIKGTLARACEVCLRTCGVAKKPGSPVPDWTQMQLCRQHVRHLPMPSVGTGLPGLQPVITYIDLKIGLRHKPQFAIQQCILSPRGGSHCQGVKAVAMLCKIGSLMMKLCAMYPKSVLLFKPQWHLCAIFVRGKSRRSVFLIFTHKPALPPPGQAAGLNLLPAAAQLWDKSPGPLIAVNKPRVPSGLRRPLLLRGGFVGHPLDRQLGREGSAGGRARSAQARVLRPFQRVEDLLGGGPLARLTPHALVDEVADGLGAVFRNVQYPAHVPPHYTRISYYQTLLSMLKARL